MAKKDLLLLTVCNACVEQTHAAPIEAPTSIAIERMWRCAWCGGEFHRDVNPPNIVRGAQAASPPREAKILPFRLRPGSYLGVPPQDHVDKLKILEAGLKEWWEKDENKDIDAGIRVNALIYLAVGTAVQLRGDKDVMMKMVSQLWDIYESRGTGRSS